MSGTDKSQKIKLEKEGKKNEIQKSKSCKGFKNQI